jgi:hypothetical protein
VQQRGKRRPLVLRVGHGEIVSRSAVIPHAGMSPLPAGQKEFAHAGS